MPSYRILHYFYFILYQYYCYCSFFRINTFFTGKSVPIFSTHYLAANVSLKLHFEGPKFIFFITFGCLYKKLLGFYAEFIYIKIIRYRTTQK